MAKVKVIVEQRDIQQVELGLEDPDIHESVAVIETDNIEFIYKVVDTNVTYPQYRIFFYERPFEEGLVIRLPRGTSEDDLIKNLFPDQKIHNFV